MSPFQHNTTLRIRYQLEYLQAFFILNQRQWTFLTLHWRIRLVSPKVGDVRRGSLVFNLGWEVRPLLVAEISRMLALSLSLKLIDSLPEFLTVFLSRSGLLHSSKPVNIPSNNFSPSSHPNIFMGHGDNFMSGSAGSTTKMNNNSFSHNEGLFMPHSSHLVSSLNEGLGSISPDLRWRSNAL